MGKINIERYFEENNGMLFPAEFTISLDSSNRELMDEISGDYDLLSFQPEQNKVIVSLPSKRSMIEGAADQINNLIDRINEFPEYNGESLSPEIPADLSDEYSFSSESADDYRLMNDYSGKGIVSRISPEKNYGAGNLKFKSTSRVWEDVSGETSSPEEETVLDQELSPDLAEITDADLQTGISASAGSGSAGAEEISDISGIVLPAPPSDDSDSPELSEIPTDDFSDLDAALEDAENIVLPDLPEGDSLIFSSEDSESEILSDLMPEAAELDEIGELDVPDDVGGSDSHFEFESLPDLPGDASGSLASELDESEIMSDLSSGLSFEEEEDLSEIDFGDLGEIEEAEETVAIDAGEVSTDAESGGEIALSGESEDLGAFDDLSEIDFGDLGEIEEAEAVDIGEVSADAESGADIALSGESEDLGTFDDLSEIDFGDLGEIEGAEELSPEDSIGESFESENLSGFEDLDFENDGESATEEPVVLSDSSDLSSDAPYMEYDAGETATAEIPDEISLPSAMEDSEDEFIEDKEEYYRNLTEKDPSDPLGWSGLGTVLADKGILDEAEYAFNQALNLDFGDEGALMGMFFILKGKGRYNEAVEFINVLIRKKPWDSTLLYEKALAEEISGNISGAERELKKAVILDPENTLAWAKLALLLVKKGRNEEALECYSELTKLKPEVSEVWYSKGLVLKSLQRCDESLSAFEKCLEINPEDADALKEKAGILLSEGNYGEAVKEYEKELSNNPESLWALSGIASSYENLGFNEKALEAYDTILGINPSEISALEGKAELLLKRHLFAEAKDTYISISSLEPDNPDIWLTIAKLSENSGLFDEAMDAYNHVLKLDPGNADGLRGRIRVLVSQGRYEESIADYNFLIIQNPSDASLIADKAIACVRTGRADEAIVLYNAALNLDKSNSKILMELIDLLTSLGRLEETLPVYDRLISLMPEETDLLLSKGLILAGVKRHREAVSCFNRVIAKKPGDPEVMLNMGISLLCLGEKEKALRCYKKSLEADPEYGNRWLESGITAASFLVAKKPDVISPPGNYGVKSDAAGIRRRNGTKKDVSDLYDSSYLSSEEEETAGKKIQSVKSGIQDISKSSAEDKQKDPEKLVRKGIELTRSGLYDIAEESLLRAIDIDDYSESGYFSLGVLYGKTERYAEAIECFEKVLMINPSNKKAGRGIIMARNKI